MSKPKFNQLVQALEVAVEHDDLTEFGIVIEHIHSCPEKERNKVIQRIKALTDKYPDFNWQDNIAETEPDPAWILNQLPTEHKLALEGGLYRQLQAYFRNSKFPHPVTDREVEALMVELINNLLKSFLIQTVEA